MAGLVFEAVDIFTEFADVESGVPDTEELLNRIAVKLKQQLRV